MPGKILAFLSVIYLIKQFLYPYYRIVTKKQKERVRKFASDTLEDERKAEALKKKRALANRLVRLPIPVLGMSEHKEEELEKLLRRLNKNKIPAEVVLEQWAFGGAGLLLVLFLVALNSVLGMIGILLAALGWFIPIDELAKAVERKNANVALNFPEFYSMCFYQYSKSVNIYLADVIRDYLPNAGEDLADELGVMLDNIDYADETYALRQLKRRVPKHFIIKFCDIMETRLRGFDNVSQMQYLKNEIDTFRVMELERELESRVSKNNMVQATLIVILALYVVIYYIFDILAAMQIFM